MNAKKKTGPSGAGQAKPCQNAQACPFVLKSQPMRHKTPAQIGQDLALYGVGGCDTFTLRHDVSVWQAREAIHKALAEARGVLMIMEESPELPQYARQALGGVLTLTERAHAALTVIMVIGESVPQREGTP